MIKAFNETIRYIESVLDDDIDEKRIVTISGYSYAMFCRLFSILTNESLSEYIRLRRLSKAAIDIKEGNDKIIDIALRYGYRSPVSFTNAFKAFHKLTPMQVRKGGTHRFVSPIQLTLSVKGGKTMDVKIQKKKAFKVAGLKIENTDSSACPDLWKTLFSRYSHEALSKLGNGQSYGMCYDVQSESKINYMACYDVNKLEEAKKLGLYIFEVDEAEYAIFSLRGPIPGCIHEGWKYAMEVFLPKNSYMHAGAPDFEVYSEGDMNSPDYTMELWIPICKH